MSRLADKYCIPSEVVFKMVKDGVISCAWPMRSDLFDRYQELKKEHPNKSQSELCYQLADEFKVSHSTAKQAIQRLR